MTSNFIFDAYGTLFDVHAAIARHRDKVGPDADRISAMWRTKQLEYSWTLTLAGHYADFWILTERALDYALAFAARRGQIAQGNASRCLFPARRVSGRARRAQVSQGKRLQDRNSLQRLACHA